MTERLIDKKDLERYFTPAQGRAPSLLDQYILEAQTFDLKPPVCEEFYCFLFSDPEDPRLAPLLNGITYKKGLYTIKVEGIKAILAQFVYARYVLKSNITDTSFGFVQKMDESSVPIDIKEKNTLYHHYRKQGFELFSRFAQYMNQSKDYPEWKVCHTGCNNAPVRVNYTSTIIK